MISGSDRSKLHVTSGNIIADALRRAFPSEAVIAWRDVLHEGPVPAGLTDDQLASIRASFLASCGWGGANEIRREMLERNLLLATASAVVLWFEFDLNDQLELLQVLSMLTDQRAELIEFAPAALCTPETALALWPTRRPVTDDERQAAKQAWEALRSPRPTGYWEHVLTMPHLAAALRRFFEQLPGSDGLSRTERQILEEVENGSKDFDGLLRAIAAREEHPYLGDTVLRLHLKRLTSGFNPPLAPEPYSLTESGKRILRGESNLMEENGIDRWVGGAHFWTH